jgi:outer membrane lipoprotein carrier protein
MRRAWLLLGAALATWAAGADAPADVRATARVEAAVSGLSSLRAEFRQTVTDANGVETERAEGTVTLAKPGRFRWEYRVPAQLIVSDGTTVWLYDADLAQVTVRPAADSLAGSPALLLAGQSDLEAEYDIADGGDAEGLAWSRLTPKGADGDFRELRVGIGGTELKRMLLVDKLGQTTRLEFERIERNPRIDASAFRFTPPPGVDVVGRAPRGGA